MSTILSKKQQLFAENPFYGKTATLNLFQQLPKVDDAKAAKSTVLSMLDSGWVELKGSKEGRDLFFTILFSMGDVQNREHNLFAKKGLSNVDQGGNSKRRVFIFCLEWMLSKSPEQFYRFLPIIGEYYNLDGTMMYELRTDRFKGTLIETLKLPIDINIVTQYIANVLNDKRTTPNEKKMWAKWLPHIPSKKRKRVYEITEKNIKSFNKGTHGKISIGDRISVSKEKKSHTETKDSWTFSFISALSRKMDWEVIKHVKNTEFKGYKLFKKQYLGDTEASMFSSKRIMTLDKSQLIEWFNQLPSDARYRVARRVVDKEKTTGKLTPGTKWVTTTGINIGATYIEWLGMKETAQQVVRNLTSEQKKDMSPNELAKLEKSAKVNTGATNLLDLFAQLLSQNLSVSQVDTIAHSVMEKLKVEVPVMVVTDISGSMNSGTINHKGVEFTPNKLATLATTLFLLKNPDPTSEPFFVRFGTNAQVVATKEKVNGVTGSNRFNSSTSTLTVDSIINRSNSFSENLKSVARYTYPTDGSTNLNSVSQGFKKWVDDAPAFSNQRIEMINMYPVVLVISDGDINSHGNAAQSVLAFQRDMQQWFGWNGVVVIWDVKEANTYSGANDGKKFEGLSNVMYFGGTNYGIVNQIFTNIHDLDIIDGFLPLKSLYLSNRYSPVRELVS